MLVSTGNPSLDGDRLPHGVTGEPSARVTGPSRTRDSRLSPTEPSETIEPSAPPSVTGRLCRDDDGSIGERDETAARLHALGIDTPLYKAFPCILKGHDHKARVHNTTAKYPQYRCGQLKGGLGLAELRALLAYGDERRITSLEAARWRERLDWEAELRDPIPVEVQLPEPCPRAAGIVAARMRLFVGLRDPRWPLSEPFVFAYDFAQAYCDLSGDRIRAAKSWLERAGVIYRAGLHGRSILWKLAAQDSALVCTR